MRWRALRAAASQLGLGVRRLGPGVPTVRGGGDAALEWSQHQSSSVIAYNDQMALGFIRTLQKRGIRVPDDVSVLGFGNSHGSGMVTPALTTVEAPLYALGSTAVSNLLAFARGAHSQSGQPLVLPTRLIVRGSTLAPARLRALK
ncbi:MULTISPECIES: LacI family DNA-binding transcriptional regulator [unclassified Arthrobacter]|uniref:LacI family DNA-binding transcriptional regulator n=1 Tax=unclassified Arthrobacter TaxID=235627 RepID=UPI003392E2EB